jgi:hypothetical protein
MIKVTGFDILISVKWTFLFYFISKRLSRSQELDRASFNIGFAFYWVVIVS